ncbi:MAG: aspartyl beta-hydroxylase [Woeseiaceae bacterium]|nr:aspartyl beta-hydroxylase [Woeseiaceae bacterium]NIP21558.1 aspartyl beta-hydroxylase [Woeseiaceae bacterium]NIS90546.1 aspartyl beta-hydroxylase [Woeseiaceae bacterium]
MAELKRGATQSALAMLNDLEQQEPADLQIKLDKALALRLQGNFAAALSALDAALAIDPYFFLALLSKGSVLEQMGKNRVAAETYRNALKIAPRPENTPEALEEPMRHARRIVEEDAREKAEYLREQLGDLRAQFAHVRLERIDECADIMAGTTRPYNAEPVQMHVPRLPAIPFFDRDHFPWMDQLEAETEAIREELSVLLSEGLPGFAPYVDYAPGTPENQFKELNRSDRWSSLWLWRDGERQESAVARCPHTAGVLEQLPLADQPGFAPTALFSALAPHTHIPPHTGSTNARLLVHLPLILPGPASFRVGNERREWRIGEAWAFDDTIEHEAWNDSDETRVIMIFDIWNPLLSAAEREMICALLTANQEWMQEVV